MEIPEAVVRPVASLRVGLTAEFEREISEADVADFARNSGDLNPLHTDAEYARSTNLGARVVHGAYQVALASAMAGMHLPGRNSFLVSYNAQFLRPLYFPCRVAVRGEVTGWDAANARGSVKVAIAELPSGIVVSQIHVGFTFHDSAREAATQAASSSGREVQLADASEIKVVLVTGASGGIGSYLVRELSHDYAVLAVVNRHSLPDELAENPRVQQIKVDLSGASSVAQIEDMLGNRRVFGIVHAAWPGLLQGGLLSVSQPALEQQLSFAVYRTIELARLLADRGEEEGGRLVVLGSTSGALKPSLHTAAYSLAKASLEHTVKLLAPELALKKITVNAVCPSFLPVGMNVQVNERQRLVAKAAVPLGRLCDTADVLGAIRFLFSKDASFVTGQTVVLSGGQL
jgi:NAD(P)-dependent dehydrogenase (short-subunit alcohol dehydrogenase family)/acyl dehydratase